MSAPNSNHAASSSREDDLKRRYTQTVKSMEGQIRNLRRSNEALERNLFTLNNRAHNAAEKLGYNAFEELEEALNEEKEYRVVSALAENNYIHREEARETSKYFSGAGDERSTKPTLDDCVNRDDIAAGAVGILTQRLDILSQKYDALLEAKEKTERKYKEDYKKWKAFKVWLFDRSKKEDTPRVKEEEPPNAPFRSDPLTDSTNLRSAQTTPTKSNKALERSEKLATLVRDEKQHPRETPINDVIAKKSPSERLNRRYNVENTSLNDQSEEFVQGNSNSPSRSPQRSPKERGKLLTGRYKRPDPINTINADFSVNAERNDGVIFAFDEIVRGREKRVRLEAGDCDCCKDYYSNVAPISNAIAPPLWKSPSKAPRTPIRGGDTTHKKRISRHRHQWAPPSTPPDYWSIGFPTTQEVASINRRAEEMHVDKRRRIEEEARSGNGRYVKKHGLT